MDHGRVEQPGHGGMLAEDGVDATRRHLAVGRRIGAMTYTFAVPAADP